MLRFISPIPPSVNKYLGKRTIYQGGRPIVVMYKTKDALAYESYMKKTLTRAIKECSWETPSKEMYVVMFLTYYMNKKRRDIDNTFKLLNDSLVENGVVHDDDVIIPRVNNLFIDSENPRVEVSIAVMDKMGVFDSADEYTEFLDTNCEGCKRRVRNCSILKKALENRIIPEIDLDKLVCKKRPVK